ncbi:MAG: AraC family transcriptional regulator [Bacteroidota bacterium]
MADYIRLHAFHHPELLQLPTLSRRFGVCTKSLTVLFKSRYGSGVHTYVMQLRHAMICELLEHTNRSIKDIAYSAGYFELSNFSRDFTRKAGLSPTAYRESRRTEKRYIEQNYMTMFETS